MKILSRKNHSGLLLRPGANGARRSRRFDARIEDGADISRVAPSWTLKRAEARALLLSPHDFRLNNQETELASVLGMLMSISRCLLICLLMLLGSSANADGVPDECTQLILGIAPTWNSMRGELRLFERSRSGDWSPVAGPFPVLFGKNGVAWGTGLAGQNEPGLRKKERDGRAPAGVFEIGEVFGYDSNLPPGADYPYHHVTEADVWSDDPRSPNYNRHVVIDPKNPPDNYTHEKMRSGDFAYHWLVEIRHNSNPPVPGVGSAIFFHIRRGLNRPTTGCTTMAETNLVKLITWLRAKRHPCYALLPATEYEKKWRSWNLPPPEKLGRTVSSTQIH